MPVYYTATLTLINNDTSTVTTTVPVTAAVDFAAGEYAVMYPLVLGPYGAAETTVYWVVRSPVTETVTTVAVSGAPVEYGLAVLVAMIVVIGTAVYILMRRARH
jgi:hypothetical protein